MGGAWNTVSLGRQYLLQTFLEPVNDIGNFPLPLLLSVILYFAIFMSPLSDFSNNPLDLNSSMS